MNNFNLHALKIAQRTFSSSSHPVQLSYYVARRLTFKTDESNMSVRSYTTSDVEGHSLRGIIGLVGVC